MTADHSIINRRDFLKLTGAAALAGASPRLWSAPEPGEAARPNIIYIMVDDLGYRDLGCYGQDKIKTPRLDRMAREGMRFTECYSGAPVCAPARSVLMTGQHAGHTPIRDNKARVGGTEGTGGLRVSLKPEVVTVAEVMKKAGYATGLSGKWGLGEPGTTGIPTRQGFDAFYGYLNQARAHNHWPQELWQNEKKVPLPGQGRRSPQRFAHPKFTRHCMDFIREHRDQPFFYYLAYTLPHWPLVMSDYGRYAKEDWPERAKAYAAMVTLIDQDVGRILDLLKQLGLDDNTLVFFCSDNGASSLWQDLFDSGGHMKGKKGSLHEGGIRVPMIARMPGTVPAGVVSDTPWYFADVLPTAADLAGVKPPADVDGLSILSTLKGNKQDLSERFMYWENPPLKVDRPLRQAARQGRYKAMRNGYGSESIRLYDLGEDHTESGNIASDHPNLARRFIEFMDKAHTPSPHWPHRNSAQAATR